MSFDQIPLYAYAKLFMRAQSSSYACETTGFHPDVFFVTRRYFFLTIVLRVTRKVTKTNLGELYRSHLHKRVTRSIFFSLLSLILIHSVDACILVMACVDCARTCSQKPFRASLNRFLKDALKLLRPFELQQLKDR